MCRFNLVLQHQGLFDGQLNKMQTVLKDCILDSKCSDEAIGFFCACAHIYFYIPLPNEKILDPAIASNKM